MVAIEKVVQVKKLCVELDLVAMGNQFFFEAVTDNCNSYEPNKCYFCVPNYVINGKSPTSPIPKSSKPRKLIRNPNTKKIKVIPPSLNCAIATNMEALSNSSNDNSSNNSSNNSPMGHSSFSTVDINISNHDDNNSSDSIGDDDNFQTQIQQDIIQKNILYVSKHCYQNSENDGSESSDIDVNVKPIRSDRNETDKTDNVGTYYIFQCIYFVHNTNL